MRTAVAGALLVALTACGGPTPAQQLVALTEDVTRQANAQDADGLREAATALADEVSAQREAGELGADQASRLLALASTLRAQADLVDPAVQAREAARARAEAEAARAAAAEQARRAQEQARAEAAREEAARRAAQEAEEAEDAGRGKGKGRGKDQERDEESDED